MGSQRVGDNWATFTYSLTDFLNCEKEILRHTWKRKYFLYKLVTQSRLTLWDLTDHSPPGSSIHGDPPGKNIEMGCHALLKGIFPTQGLNSGLLQCRWILYQLSHKGNPRILEWVAYPFSSGSSWPRNWTGVSCIAGRFFTNWVKVILSSKK